MIVVDKGPMVADVRGALRSDVQLLSVAAKFVQRLSKVRAWH
jgi:hypothetical protein